MHVSRATEAPQFINLPSRIVRIVLDTLGKGHLDTLMRISLYLWGGQVPLEGAAGEFSKTMGIEERTWQRHTPELGRAGLLRYRQPQYGLYVLVGFPSDPSFYKACADEIWARFEALPRVVRPKRYKVPEMIDDLFLKSKPSILSVPVVVDSSKELRASKEQDTSSSLEGGVGGGKPSKLSVCAAEPSKLSVSLCDPLLVEVMRLYEQEIGGTVTAMLADEMRELLDECRDVERWRFALRQSVGARNRWRYARAVILHPERKPGAEVKRGNGRSGGGASSGGDVVPGGASSDIAAWFNG